jgi:RNA polymerase sigma-70 factor (ECF subfamily)
MTKAGATAEGTSSSPSEWVDRHADALFRYALLRLRDPEAAEELVQEAFLAALSAHQDFRTESSERTWLIGILKHKIIDHFRRKARQESPDDPAGSASGLHDVFTKSGKWRAMPGKWPTRAEQGLEDRELREVLAHCLSALPQGLARGFVLREMEGLSSQEVCKVLQVSSTNLWVMLHRARLSLRRCVERNWFGRDRTGD